MDNRFYVYEFIKLDTGEPFYVGKGCGNRVNDIHRGRSNWFKDTIKKHGAISRVVIDNLTEKEAYEAEVWFIYEYKHILNYKLVNLDDGGYGATNGESNPMYGKRGELSPLYGRKATLQRRENISKALKGKTKSQEHIKNLIASQKNKDISGKNNPNYGNGLKISGGKNPSAVRVRVIYNGQETIFETKFEACEFYGISKYLLNNLIGKVINVKRDFSRQLSKYEHLEGCLFELIDEGATTSRKTYTIS